jgi:hypothetical protein
MDKVSEARRGTLRGSGAAMAAEPAVIDEELCRRCVSNVRAHGEDGKVRAPRARPAPRASPEPPPAALSARSSSAKASATSPACCCRTKT